MEYKDKVPKEYRKLDDKEFGTDENGVEKKDDLKIKNEGKKNCIIF